MRRNQIYTQQRALHSSKHSYVPPSYLSNAPSISHTQNTIANRPSSHPQSKSHLIPKKGTMPLHILPAHNLLRLQHQRRLPLDLTHRHLLYPTQNLQQIRGLRQARSGSFLRHLQQRTMDAEFFAAGHCGCQGGVFGWGGCDGETGAKERDVCEE